MTETAAQGEGRPAIGYALLNLAGGEVRLEPIFSASPFALDVLLREPGQAPAVGEYVPRLRLFAQGSCCLDTPALVRAALPATHQQHGRGVLLTLEPPPPDPRARDRPALDSYRDAQTIADTVANLVGIHAAVTLERAEMKQHRRSATAHVHEDTRRSRGLVLELGGERPPSFHKGQRVAVHAEVYGTRLALAATFRSRRGGRVYLDWPSLLHIWWRRSANRLPAEDRQLEVELTLPVVGERAVRRASNLSASGLALRLESSDALLAGTRLDGLVLRLEGTHVRGRGLVRNVRQEGKVFVAGVEFTPGDAGSRDSLRSFVERQVHAHVRRASLADLESLWAIWDELRLFSRPHAAMSPGVLAINASRHALLEQGEDTMIAVMGSTEGAPQATAELWRAYAGTWALQHLGRTVEASVSSAQLLAAVLEQGLRTQALKAVYVLCDPHADAFLLGAVERLCLAPTEVSLRPCALLSPPASGRLGRGPESDVRNPNDAERQWIAARLASMLSALEVEALDLAPADLELGGVSSAYQRLGLVRTRALRIAMGVSGPAGFALIEQGSPGLSLTGLADLTRLFLVVAEAPARRAALLGLAREALALGRARGASPQLVAERGAALALAEAGFGSLGERLELVLARSAAARLAGHLRLRP